MNEADQDLLDDLVGFFKVQSGYSFDIDREAVLEVRGSVTYGRYVRAVLGAGGTGSSEDIYSTSANKVTHKKKSDEAIIRPFTVTIGIPKAGGVALMAVERHGNIGIVTELRVALATWFKERHEDYRIHIDSWVPPGYWETFVKEGEVLELQLEKQMLPSDLADRAPSGTETKQYSTKVQFKPLDRGTLVGAKEWIQSTVIGKPDDAKAGQFILDGVEYQRARGTFSHNGIDRTIDLSELQARVAPTFLLDSKKAANGYPDPQSLGNAARSLLAGFLKDLPDVTESDAKED